MTRVEQIETRLRAALSPVTLAIEDESALHAGHAGARGGAGHYRVRIVAQAFAGKNTVTRHRLVYDALRDMMPGEIHALAIDAAAPDES